MTRFLIYGKMRDNIYSLITGELTEAKQMVRKLKIIHPLEEFYIATLPNQLPVRLEAWHLEGFLKEAVRA